MKFLFCIAFCCLTITTYGQRLNGLIAEAQKIAVQTSSYYDAKYRFHVHKSQSQFRLTKFPTSISQLLLSKVHLTDTFWIAESFDDMCPMCPSYASEILYKDSFYYYNEIGDDSTRRQRFTVSLFDTEKNVKNYILSEITDSVRQGYKWLFHPLTYGSNLCFDGDHTLVTVVYPD